MKKLDDLVYRPTDDEKEFFIPDKHDSAVLKSAKKDYLTYIPKELSETVEMMSSPDYKVRFRGEYFQEKIRAEKLEKFVLKIEVGMEKDSRVYAPGILESNQPKHDCPIELLQEQLYAMKEKLRIFKKRAIYENIELE